VNNGGNNCINFNQLYSPQDRSGSETGIKPATESTVHKDDENINNINPHFPHTPRERGELYALHCPKIP